MTTEYVLDCSYGKDSLACLEAIKILGLPLTRIIHAEVWATPTIPADLPPMVEFKKKADKIIKERYGITVEHITAMKPCGGGRTPLNVSFTLQEKIKYLAEPYMASLVLSIRGATANLKSKRYQKLTYEDIFYREIKSRSGGVKDLRLPRASGTMVQLKSQNVSNQPITGFATKWSQYCTGELKRKPFSQSPNATGDINIVHYLGIAADEPTRIARHQQKENIRLPLVEIGWSEADCRKWCEENDLLSPIYTTATRGGCWFCHNQGVEQLRLLRRNYPDLWALLLKWDADSPTTFKPDGHTVHDFDKRFELEDKGVIKENERFYWKYIK